MSDPAKKYFYSGLRDSERAAFEAGIALATAYHYLLGLPLPRSKESAHTLLSQLSESLKAQPFREKVQIRAKFFESNKSPYRYSHIDSKSLEVRVVVRYGGARVWAKLSWVEDLNYPLMRIEKIQNTRSEKKGQT